MPPLVLYQQNLRLKSDLIKTLARNLQCRHFRSRIPLPWWLLSTLHRPVSFPIMIKVKVKFKVNQLTVYHVMASLRVKNNHQSTTANERRHRRILPRDRSTDVDAGLSLLPVLGTDISISILFWNSLERP